MRSLLIIMITLPCPHCSARFVAPDIVILRCKAIHTPIDSHPHWMREHALAGRRIPCV